MDVVTSPGPLTFLAGKALAKSVGMMAIDFLLLIATVPHYLQYVVCHLRPGQLMQLFYKSNDKLENHNGALREAVAGFFHVNVMPGYWSVINIFEHQPPNDVTKPHAIRLDSNNLDDSILSSNMYLSLISWSSYLFDTYNIVLPPTLRWVQDYTGQIIKLAVLPMQLITTNDVKHLIEWCDVACLDESVQNVKKLIVKQVMVPKITLAKGYETISFNINKVLAYMQNEHCQYKLWKGLSVFVDDVEIYSGVPNMEIEKYYAISFCALMYHKLLNRVFLYGELEPYEKLDFVVRHMKIGHGVFWNYLRPLSQTTYNDLLLMINSCKTQLSMVISDRSHLGSKSNIDYLLNAFYEFVYLKRDCLLVVPCAYMQDMSFYNSLVDKMLHDHCKNKKLLTVANVPNFDTFHQFQKPVKTAESLEQLANFKDIKYKRCCPSRIGDSTMKEYSLFGHDSVLCYLIAALNLFLIGRHHLGLIYAVETVWKMTRHLSKFNNHYHKVFQCQAWVVLTKCLNKCFGPLNLAWNICIAFAQVSDVDLLFNLVLELSSTRACFAIEQQYMDSIFFPKLMVSNSTSSFACIIQHLYNLFQKFENEMVLLLMKANYKKLVDVTCCGTDVSLEMQCWLTGNRIEYILNRYLLKICRMCHVAENQRYFAYFKLKSNFLRHVCVANLDRVERIANYVNTFSFSYGNSAKVHQLSIDLQYSYTCPFKIEVDIFNHYITSGFTSFNNDFLTNIANKIKCKTRLEHSIELGNIYFFLGILHLKDVNSKKLELYDVRNYKCFFTKALEQYEVATSTVDDAKYDLHRLGLTRKLAQVEKTALEMIVKHNQVVHNIQLNIPQQRHEQEEIQKVYFRDMLRANTQDEMFINKCFQDIAMLSQEKNNNDNFHLNSNGNFQSLYNQANAAINSISCSQAVLNAIFDVRYNH